MGTPESGKPPNASLFSRLVKESGYRFDQIDGGGDQGMAKAVGSPRQFGPYRRVVRLLRRLFVESAWLPAGGQVEATPSVGARERLSPR